MTSKRSPIRSNFLLCSLLAVCFAGMRSPQLWAEGTAVCGPSSAVKAALDEVASYQTASQTDWQFHELVQSSLHPLLQRYPNDVFVARAYVRFMLDSAESERQSCCSIQSA